MLLINERVVLASRPDGSLTPENFRLERSEVPDPHDGQVLLEIAYLSLDPYMCGRMDARESYAEPVAIGAVMEGGTVARVLRSRHPDHAEGEVVLSHSGWQRYAVTDGAGLRKLDPGIAPVSTALGVLGMPAFAAYVGLRTIGRPKPGETLVVAAASGAVGSAVGQIARIDGARAVGIAGGSEKCAFVRDVLRFDAVVDHRAPDFADRLAAACPAGIDVYFENVGGAAWDAVQPLLNRFARVPVAGLIAHVNEGSDTSRSTRDRLTGVMLDISVKSLTIQGFVQKDFPELWPDFYREATGWFAAGRLRHKEDLVDGLEHAPDALIGLLQGRNFGKLIVRV